MRVKLAALGAIVMLGCACEAVGNQTAAPQPTKDELIANLRTRLKNSGTPAVSTTLTPVTTVAVPVPPSPAAELPKLVSPDGWTCTPPPISLVNMIRLAWDANPDFKAAEFRADMADEQLARARADLFPNLTANFDAGRTDNPLRKFSYLLSEGKTNPAVLFNAADDVNNYRAYIKLDYELYTGGLRLAQVRAADAGHDATHHALQAARNRLVFQVAEAYYRYFQASQVVSVRAEVVQLVEAQIAELKVRERNQMITHNEVLKAELKLSDARERLVDARTKEKLARAVLENVAGVPLTDHKLPEKLETAPWAKHVDRIEQVAAQYAAAGGRDPKRTVAYETSQRPELVEGEDTLRAARQRIEIAAAGAAPKIGFTSDYSFYAGDFQQVKGTYFLGLVVSMNLFDAGRTKAEVREAQIAADEVLARNQRLRMDIELDIRRSLLELQGAKEKLAVAESGVRSATENLTAIQAQVKNQFATQTDLFEAQVALSESKMRVLTSTTEIEIARASLERSTGCLSGLLDLATRCRSDD